MWQLQLSQEQSKPLYNDVTTPTSRMPKAKFAGRESVRIIVQIHHTSALASIVPQSLQNAGLPLMTKQVINAVRVLL